MLPQSLHETAERVFTGAKFAVHAVRLPGSDGSTARREVVEHGGAVLILPKPDRDTVLLIRNERFAVGDTLWELPAGTLETEENPADCAARELAEETGYRAGTIRPLTRFYTSPGFCTERMHAYVAEELTHVGQDLDPTERITVEKVARDEALEMARDGRIEDGKTLCALLYLTVFGTPQ